MTLVPFLVPARSNLPDLFRGLLIAMVALALAGAPSFAALGVGPDVRELTEPGAAGVLPFAADPGHRMSPASAAGGSVSAGIAAAAWRWNGWLGPSVALAAAAPEGASHAWLRLLLIGARLQTDGG